jgi:cysteine desulfurase/selenocysteine lyase
MQMLHLEERMINPGTVNNYNIEAIRADFPILSQQISNHLGSPDRPLIYLDSSASAQKPRQVIEAMNHFYEHDYANVHRGFHYLSNKATDAYEAGRETVRAFLNARSIREIIFTRNATEAINLVAYSYGHAFLKENDEIILSVMEHHANIIPWQLLRSARGVVLKVAPIDDDGNFLLETFSQLLGPRTRLVTLTHVSNVLGTVTPIQDIIKIAHAADVPVLLDGSQGAVHLPVDVCELGVDFYVLTGHKLYGPSGIGVLYGREELLERMPPFMGGGGMIRSVSFDQTAFAEIPARFEAGTPPIAEVVGLAAAINYINQIGHKAIVNHECELLHYATAQLRRVPGLRVIGQAESKAAIISFVMDCAHPHDISTIVDRAGVAIRAGHHCAQPLMHRFDVPAMVRASFGLYNSRTEVDILVEALFQVRELLSNAG